MPSSPKKLPKNKVDETESTTNNLGTQARNHGNEPSKGAKIDAEIDAEEKETLRKKGVDV